MRRSAKGGGAKDEREGGRGKERRGEERMGNEGYKRSELHDRDLVRSKRIPLCGY